MNALTNKKHLSNKPKLHHKALFYSLGAIGLIWVAIMVTLIFLYQKPVQQPSSVLGANTSKPDAKQSPEVFYSPLTGQKVADVNATKQTVTGIMIENSPDARPQSGLKDAGVVYEAIAEGGITRFLALYQESKPQLIGPVRSLRMYYLDWVAAYNASIAHVGGSLASLNEVRNGSYRDIDQFYNAGSYWRASDRYAPHNVYTNFEKIDALNRTKGYNQSNFEAWPRVDTKPAPAIDAKDVSMTISGPLYNVLYNYDPATGTYLRNQGGGPHLDREKGQITPNVVIALKVNQAKIMEDGYRESIQTTGSGEAFIFQNGTVIKATWLKDARHTALKFVDDKNKPIALNRGQVWISAIPNSYGDVSWQ